MTDRDQGELLPYTIASHLMYDQCIHTVLVGPNGFECWLTEPEDRIWSRDLRPVVNELNRLASALEAVANAALDSLDVELEANIKARGAAAAHLADVLEKHGFKVTRDE